MAVNAAELNPEGTVTEDGTVSRELLLPSRTVVPPVGAVAVKDTVQLELAFGPSVVGRHTRVANSGTVMFPPVGAEILSAVPVTLAATGFGIVIEVEVAAGARVTLTEATTPDAMVLVFNPVKRQVDKPPFDAQDSTLLAAIADGPGAWTIEIWAGS